MIKVGINGFGRIGRLLARIILTEHQGELELAAINTSGSIDLPGWAHLFKYDSSYGQYPGQVKVKAENLLVDGQEIPVSAQRDPAEIPWKKLGVQVVAECTGVFRTSQAVKPHLGGTVKRVVLSAPAKDEQIKMYVVGVNESGLGKEPIVSCASCTTNCIAPIVKLMEERFGIEKSLMTTIHAYTTTQELLDGSNKDLRRGRAAAVNIIPTTTGAAKSTIKVFPQVKGKFDGLAVRVPVTTGSLTDLVFLTKQTTSKKEVNQVFQQASQGKLKGVLATTDEPLVSKDIVGRSHSAVVDLEFTRVVGGNLVKVLAWYDNEWGYASRLAEELVMVGKQL